MPGRTGYIFQIRTRKMTSEERRQGRYERRRAKREEKRKAFLREYGTYERAVNRNALAKAAKQAASGVRYKASVKRYMQRRLINVAIVNSKLEHGKDVRKGFVCFNAIERGKLRRIMSVHFSERVPQKSLNQNVLIPVMTRPLIYDNGASRKGMGTSHALTRLTIQLRRHYRRYGVEGYVLQTDFKNYFGSIDHALVKALIRRSFDDRRVADLACSFVDAYYEHALKNGGTRDISRPLPKDRNAPKAVGLGLGSEENQTLAIAHPSPVDHYIKEVLHIKAYGRYNDDLYLVHQDKEYLKYCLDEIRKKCAELKITLNEDKTHITKLSHGFTFLKTKILLTESGAIIKTPCRDSISDERRKLKRQKKLYDAGLMTEFDVCQSFQSWKGSMKRRIAGRSVYNMTRLYRELFTGSREKGD